MAIQSVRKTGCGVGKEFYKKNIEIELRGEIPSFITKRMINDRNWKREYRKRKRELH